EASDSAQSNIAGQRLGDARAFDVIDRKCRIGHTERIEKPLFLEFVQRFSRNDLDDATENIGRVAVIPQRARLFGQRQFREPLCELRVVEVPVKEPTARIEFSNGTVAVKSIRDARGVPEQVENSDRTTERFGG